MISDSITHSVSSSSHCPTLPVHRPNVPFQNVEWEKGVAVVAVPELDLEPEPELTITIMAAIRVIIKRAVLLNLALPSMLNPTILVVHHCYISVYIYIILVGGLKSQSQHGSEKD